MKNLSVRRVWGVLPVNIGSVAMLLLLIILGTSRVMAQDQAITGVVTETDGTPLPGVTVALKSVFGVLTV